MSSVFTFGESLALLRGDGLGSWEDLAAARVDTGGAEGNTAIGLARLDVPVTWLGRVGHDALGRRVVADLRSQGVHVRAVVDPGAPTGLMLKSAPRPGSTAVDYYRAGSAGSRISPADLDDAGIAEHALVHVTGVTLALSDSARATVAEAAAQARAAGAAVSFAINHRSRMWGEDEARAAYLRTLAAADVVFATLEEAQLLVGAGDAATCARRLAELGPAEVLITLGEEGALARCGGDEREVPAVPVTVVDTVGAGDAFAAGYLAERVAGAGLPQRLATAVRAGASACGHAGDWRGALRAAEKHAVAADGVSR